MPRFKAWGLLSLLVSLLFFMNSCLPSQEKASEGDNEANAQGGASDSDASDGDSQSGGSLFGDLESLLSGQVSSMSGAGDTDFFNGEALADGSAEGAYEEGGSVDEVSWDARFAEDPYITSYLNELRGSAYEHYMCPQNSFMVGQYSLYHQHEEGTEWSDRQYKMVCQYLSDGTGRPLERENDSACVAATKTEFPENYKEEYTCPEGTFLAGHFTNYISAKSMRKHSFACCKVKHPDDLSTSFHQYEVYGLEHAGTQKNCFSNADATSYLRRNFWHYQCPENSLLNKVTITNVPETSKTSSYTTYESKPEDPLFGYECCEVGVQQDGTKFIFAHTQSNEYEVLPYERYPMPEE